MNNDGLKRRATEGDVEANPSLSDFQVYFHRRPLRVQNAFADFEESDEKPLELREFSNFMENQLQYPGAAMEIFDDLSKTLDGKVTWGGLRTLLEPPWKRSSSSP